jgi:hypothetical protein
MNIGQTARYAFMEAIKLGGATCDAGGEQRKAIKDQKAGSTIFMFPEEFSLKRGDKIREIATESYFTVVEFRPVSAADSFMYFEVTTHRDL